MKKIINKKTLLVIIIIILATLFYLSNLKAIKYLFIGDEYAFFLKAKDLASTNNQANIFSMNGVYNDPIMGSYYQAFVMKLFGINIMGWKISSLIIIVPILLMTYLITNKLFNYKISIFGLLITTTSFYYYNFFQIGYLNNLSLLCLYAIITSIVYLKKNKYLPTVLGILTGISWYFYIGKLFSIIFFIYIFLTTFKKKDFYKKLITYSFVLLLIISPSFIFSNYKIGNFGLSKTILYKEFSNNSQVLKNITYGLILPVYTPSKTHYLPINSYLDIITAITSLSGLILILINYLRKKNENMILTDFLKIFILTMFFIGITSPYSYPPTTRGIHYMPFYFIFSSYFLFYVSNKFKKTSSFTYLICLIIILVNLYYIYSFLPLNLTQKIVSSISKLENKKIIFIDNCDFNFYNIKTIVEGLEINNLVNIKPDFEIKECSNNNYLFSCSLISCKSNLLNIFDNRIFFYKILK